MTVTGGARPKRRTLALSFFGTLIAAALVLCHGPGVAQAAEAAATGADAKPAKAASAKKKAGTTKTKTTARKRKSATVAKVKHPLPPPPKPATTAGGTAKTDIAVSLDRGAAEVTPTASREGEAKIEPSPAPDDPKGTAAKPAPKPADSAAVAASAPPAAVEPKIAAAPPEPAVTLTKESLRIQFAPNGSDLPESAGSSIGELAALMSREPSLRLQLLAFAAGTTETASQSRRLSLNRALAVRGALIDAGVRSTRIDVRALGNRTDESPLDRVDILVMQRSGG